LDVGGRPGLNDPNVWGGVARKRSIIEAKEVDWPSSDYDNDGWLDITLRMATGSNAHWPPGRPHVCSTKTTATARLVT